MAAKLHNYNSNPKSLFNILKYCHLPGFEPLLPGHNPGRLQSMGAVCCCNPKYHLYSRAKNDKEYMSNRTFTMIKPDAFSKGHSGAIIDKIIKSGFRIVALKLTQLSTAKAGEFYAVHKERPFYGELVQFMSSGPIIAAILEKDNAVADFRKLIGATDPAKADEGTIRKLFASSVGENAVHGSDSDENAAIEGSFFFSGLEQI
jgi:nucleoside-diphosphate kinase